MKILKKSLCSILIVAILVSLLSYSQAEAADTVSIYVIDSINKKFDTGGRGTVKIKYNNKGFITKYDDKGYTMRNGAAYWDLRKYTYDSHNRIKKVYTDQRFVHDIIYYFKYKNGLCTKITKKYYDFTADKYIKDYFKLEYNSNKTLKSYTQTNTQTKESSKVSYKYNKSGQVVSIFEKNPSNSYTTKFTYDKRGQLKTEKDSSLCYKYGLTYKNGRLVTCKTTSDNVEDLYKYKYKKIKVSKKNMNNILKQQKAMQIYSYSGIIVARPDIFY